MKVFLSPYYLIFEIPKEIVSKKGWENYSNSAHISTHVIYLWRTNCLTKKCSDKKKQKESHLTLLIPFATGYVAISPVYHLRTLIFIQVLICFLRNTHLTIFHATEVCQLVVYVNMKSIVGLLRCHYSKMSIYRSLKYLSMVKAVLVCNVPF